MPVKFLSQDDLLAVHHASLRILSEVGIILDDAGARALLLDNGAGGCGERTCIPPHLVEACLARCPTQVALRGREGSEVVLGAGALQVHNLGGARDVLDRPGGDPRPATAGDVAESTRLLDALPNVTTITPLYTPRDVPSPAMVPTMFAQTVRHTLKPINGPAVHTRVETLRMAEMMHVVFGAGPAVSLAASPVSPLHFPEGVAQAMLEVARRGFPFGPLPCPQTGSSAPMSLAGALALQNAEVLASIVLVQLEAPGLPVIYCGRLATIDMRTALPTWGNPEIGVMSAATVQIGHHYHLPVNVYGLAGNSYAIDVQAGYERVLNAIVPALAGADELSGVGEIGGGTLSSNAQIVLDNEIMGMVGRVRRGLVVSEDTLAVDVIAGVMDSQVRFFLGEPHTVRHLRTDEHWEGRLGVKGIGWARWDDAGRPTAVERAQAEAECILAGHEIPPLTDEQSRALDEIVQTASRECEVPSSA
jgi:trimethylamine--corrinoid protein Co-methyltransferase